MIKVNKRIRNITGGQVILQQVILFQGSIMSSIIHKSKAGNTFSAVHTIRPDIIDRNLLLSKGYSGEKEERDKADPPEHIILHKQDVKFEGGNLRQFIIEM